MSTTIKDGVLSVYVDDLIRDETVLRTVAKYALFEEMTLNAMAQVFVNGQIDWNDGDLPWYRISGSFNAAFEQTRRELCRLAPEGAKALLDDICTQRDRAVSDRDVYQTRAWRAEQLLRQYERAIRDAACGDQEDLSALRRAINQPAHAVKDSNT